MPLDFHGLDLTHPVNRIPAGRVAMAENVRAYGQGQFELRNALSGPIVVDSSPIVLDSSVQSLARMNDTTPAGPEIGYVLISEDAAGKLYADDTAVASVAIRFRSRPSAPTLRFSRGPTSPMTRRM